MRVEVNAELPLYGTVVRGVELKRRYQLPHSVVIGNFPTAVFEDCDHDVAVSGCRSAG